MAIGTGMALLGSALIGAGSSYLSGKQASKAAQSAAGQQSRAIQAGIEQSQPYYEQGQNYLAPYVEGGQQSATLLNDILGMNGPEAQQKALGMYQSSPSANLLKQAQEEAVRRSAGEFASGGLLRSGAMTTELARRLSDMSLSDYYKWQDLGTGLFNTGANAAGSAASLAANRGNTILGARTSQGAAQAQGTQTAGNIGAASTLAGANYLQNYLGSMGNAANGGNDLSKWFFG